MIRMMHMPDTHHAPSFAQPTVLYILAPYPQLALPEEDSGNPSRNVVFFFQKNQLVYSENVLVIMCDSRQESPKLSFKEELRLTYGSEALGLVRTYRRCCEKLARCKNHVIFNLRCKGERFVPPSLRVKNLTYTKRGQAIAERAGRAFLLDRVDENIRKRRELEEQKNG